jgi:hypothetical protein
VIAMVQMSINSIFADCYGMSIFRISRGYVADIHFSPLSYRSSYIESRNSDTTLNEKEWLFIGHHIFLFMISCKPSPTSV